MVSRIDSSRKARFKAALARVGKTQRAWAKEQDVSYTHLYLTLVDESQSKTLTGKIDAFVEQIEQKAKSA